MLISTLKYYIFYEALCYLILSRRMHLKYFLVPVHYYVIVFNIIIGLIFCPFNKILFLLSDLVFRLIIRRNQVITVMFGAEMLIRPYYRVTSR